MKKRLIPCTVGALILVANTYGAKPISSCKVGGYCDRGGFTSQTALNQYEADARKEIKVYMFYNNFGNMWPTIPLENAASNDKIPHMKFAPTNGSHPPNAIYEHIKNGWYDDDFEYLGDQIASYIQSVNRNFWFDFAHEMNGFWKPFQVTDWGTPNAPGQFKGAFTRIRDILRSRLEIAGVPKHRVKMIFAPDDQATAGIPDYRLLDNIYPGNDVVDMLGISIYNKSQSWKGFIGTHINNVHSILSTLSENEKPFGFSECGAQRESRRPQWIRDNFTETTFSSYDISYFNWYDSDHDEELPCELTDAGSQDAFGDSLADSFFAGQ